MRLHVNDCMGDDPVKAELTRFAVIYLDGVKQRSVIWADEETGEIECYISFDEMLAKGGYSTNPEWPTEVKKGRVVIKDSRDEYKPTDKPRNDASEAWGRP